MRALDALRALAAPFLYGPVTEALRFAREPEYRRHLALRARLAGLPRQTPAAVECGGYRVELLDAPSFLSAHYEIFVREAYRFAFAGEAPSIVDLGANIGLATLWFKRAYPRARIVALEPDPALFACLERNVRANRLADVELVERAAWNVDAELDFLPDGADGGRLGPGSARSFKVKALAIDRFLAGRPIDFLKIDIEGAEAEVLAACRPLLPRVGGLFVEYHARKDAPSRLGGIATALEEAGFRLRVEELGPRRRRWLGEEDDSAFDLQLNVFAWRPGAQAR